MKLFLNQFDILLWKCWLLKRRHYVSTFFEFVLPLLTSVAMVIAVSTFKPEKKMNTKIETGYQNGPTVFNTTAFDLNRNLNFLLSTIFQTYFLTAPSNNCTAKFMNDFKNELTSRVLVPDLSNLHFESLENEDELDYKISLFKDDNQTNIIGILFTNECSENYNDFLKYFAYTIKCLAPLTLTPAAIFPDKPDASPSKENFYTNFNQIGFIETQNLVNIVYLNSVKDIQGTGKNFEIQDVKAYKYPYPSYVARPPGTLIDFLPTVLIYGFIILFPIIVKRQSSESYNRVREMFKLMGLNDWAYYGSSFVHYFIEVNLQVAILTFLYCFKFGPIAVFSFTNPMLVYIIILLYTVNLILMAFLISILFKRPIVAVVVSLIIYVATDYLRYIIDPKYNKSINSNSINYIQLFSCLFPNSSINFMMRMLSILEVYSTGGNFSNLFEVSFQYGFLSVGLILCMNILSIFMYSILIWYLDAVYPLQYGIIKPWYFFLNPLLKLFQKTDNQNEQILENTETESKYFESEKTKNKVKISIKNLSKKFGKKTAVSGVNLNLHENHLIALLGPNGAGKTTLMSMITGLFKATKGNIIIDDYDIQKDPKKARTSLSLCPQHNALYDELTAYEHLILYGIIKGKSTKQELEQEINELLEKVGLEDKKNEITEGFSGGMKRKLNLAIALVGQSKIVVLEPTSGMDPESRRCVWDVLLKEKRNRTILLTTHFIEEADVLGDRIFIMNNGKPKCHGTPVFLKRIFGMGYQLRIAKDLSFNGCNESRIKLNDFIKQYFKNSTIMNENVGEVIYSLNTCSKEDEIFPDFFKNFEQIKDQLHISTFGITVTTLEDVFLKILNLSSETNGSESSRNQLTVSSSGYDSSYNLTGTSINTSIYSESVAPFLEDTNQNDKIKNKFLLFRQRINGLLIKRVCHSKRYYPMIVFQVLIPVFIFWVILYLDAYLRPTWKDNSSFILDTFKLYGTTNGFFKDDIDDKHLFESYNMTGYNASMNVIQLNWEDDPNQYLLNISNKVTISTYIKEQLYGGVVKKSIGDNKRGLLLDIEVWYNNEATQSLPLSINAIYNSLLEFVNDQNTNEYQTIQLTNKNLPNPFSLKTKDVIIKGLKLMWSVMVSLSLPFIAASYSLFPIHEYITKSKLLQKMSGASGYLYWLTTFIYDIFTHIIVSGLILLLFYWQDKNGIFVDYKSSMSGLFLLLFIFGLASMNLSYLLSRSFDSATTGFLVIVIVHLIFGVILSVIDFLLWFLFETKAISRLVYDFFQWIFRMSPIYAMSKGISNMYLLGSRSHMCDELSELYLRNNCGKMSLIKGCCKKICGNDCYAYKNPFVWSSEGILMEVFSLTLVFILTFAINLIIEESLVSKLFKLMPRFKNKGDRVLLITGNRSERYLENSGEDSDVIQEKRRVETLVEQPNKKSLPQAMLVHHLTKVFNKFIAVDDLSFALEERECFGLLGVNGAGKTTTFRMLVGDLEPTEGTAFIKNINLKDNLKQFQKQIGYCPQFDALLDNLTGEEMLYLFGRLRGIKERNLRSIVDCIIKMVDLTDHYKFLCSTYSGGNKRKLSLGMALIGLPKIIFLDEPTSGVSAEARRKIWKTLVSIKEKFNCSIVLTSHSMDECEALSTRIGIMVSGKFKCINSVQNLRQKYGKGYTLTIKLKPECLEQQSFYMKKLQEELRSTFPSAILKDFHETLLTYQIVDNKLKWSFLFTEMDKIKTQFDLEYYLLSDTTLESIFVNFAKTNHDRLI